MRIGRCNDLLFRHDDQTEQLVLESFDRHREINDRCLGEHFRRVGRIAEFRRDVETEARHDVHLFVPDLHLIVAAGLNEVLLEKIVERRIQLLSDVFDEEWPTVRQRVLEVRSKRLMVEVRYLEKDYIVDKSINRTAQCYYIQNLYS